MAKTELYQFEHTEAGIAMLCSDGTEIVLAYSELTPEVKLLALVQGLKKKITDGAALSRNPETGRSASDADKIARMVAIAERLRRGDWRMSGSGEGAPTGGYLLRALCELYPTRSVEQLREFIARKSEAEKVKLRASSKIAPIIERLKAEKSRPSPMDEADLFAGLDDEEQPDD